MRLFEALGGWVATVPELDVKMRLGTHCYKHAWHADLWHKRLPELREMNPERLNVPPNDAMVRFIEVLTEPEAPELTIEKLVGVYRVLIPRFIAAYTFHLNGTSQITDAPTIRSLRFILQDEYDDWRDGEMMIQSLLEHARGGRSRRRPPGAPGGPDGGGRGHRRAGQPRCGGRAGRCGGLRCGGSSPSRSWHATSGSTRSPCETGWPIRAPR